jgi:putative addiction module killer protein
MVTFVLPMKMIEIRQYIDERGTNHFARWRTKLDPSIKVRIDQAVLRLGDGLFSNTKPEGEGVSALRIDSGPGYRVYFGKDGETLVLLLAGGTKRRQTEDILLSRKLWAEYKRRKSGGR